MSRLRAVSRRQGLVDTKSRHSPRIADAPIWVSSKRLGANAMMLFRVLGWRRQARGWSACSRSSGL
jgi:hypothetical protein